MTREQIVAELRLFKSFTNSQEDYNLTEDMKQVLSQNVLEAGIVIDKPGDIVNDVVINEAIDMYGIKPEQWNNTFHKSFSTVRDTPIQKLIAEQLIHYFTTYGLEELGVYNEDLVYVPIEQIDIPEYTVENNIDKVGLVVIHSITEEELGNKLLELVTSGIALSQDTVSDIMILSDYIDKGKFDDIKNKEVKTALYDKYNLTPSSPIEFLRYVIYKTTDKTLLIKDKDTLDELKRVDVDYVIKWFNSYTANYGYKKLSSIFLRYKPIFLAFKRPGNKEINRIINRLRRYAKKYHTPVKEKILDTLTQIETKKDLTSNKQAILSELNNVTVFKEISILNSLAYRLSDNSDSIMYRVRNGKAWVEDTSDWKISITKENAQKELYNMIEEHLVNRIKPNLEGKNVYIPEMINYTVPTSEKQFADNIPEGSYIEIDRDDNLVVGIHWKNTKNGRVDLDIHAQNRSEQYGWNTLYKSASGESEFYFTGDITDALGELGATELFYIGKAVENKAFLLTLNKYSAPFGEDIPYEVIAAKCGDDDVEKNYTVDPNKVLLQLHGAFRQDERSQKTIGFVKLYPEKIRLYFNDFSLTGSIVTTQTGVTQKAFDYLFNYTDTQLKLRPLLEKCGVTFLDEPKVEKFQEVEVQQEDGTKEILYKKIVEVPDLDLSLERIDKTSLIKIFGGV